MGEIGVNGLWLGKEQWTDVGLEGGGIKESGQVCTGLWAVVCQSTELLGS